MNVLNRTFVSLLALIWCALLGGLLYLVWEQAQGVDVDNSAFALSFDWLAETQAEKILATLVLGALMVPAAGLILMELTVHGRRTDIRESQTRERQLEARVEALQRRLDEQRPSGQPVSQPRPEVGTPQPQRERRRWRFLPSR